MEYIKCKDMERDKRGKCQECGQAPIRYLHFLRDGKEVIAVGGTCLKKLMPEKYEEAIVEEKRIRSKSKRRLEADIFKRLEEERTKIETDKTRKKIVWYEKWEALINRKYKGDFKLFMDSEEWEFYWEGKNPPKTKTEIVDIFDIGRQ